MFFALGGEEGREEADKDIDWMQQALQKLQVFFFQAQTGARNASTAGRYKLF